MKYLAIRFWDDIPDEKVIGTFDTEIEARAAIDKDFEEYGSGIFIREHVGYRVQEVNDEKNRDISRKL